MDSDAEADIEPTNYVTISQDVKAGIGDFILVKFGEQKFFFYVGRVEDVDMDSVMCYFIRYYRRQNKSNFFYEPAVDDMGVAMRSDLVAKLKDPKNLPGTSRSKNKICFDLNFGNFDVR